jgi:hypothetical protein
MTTPRPGAHTASELRRSTRRLDRLLTNVDEILCALRKGEELHLQHQNNRPLWSLSSGRNVAASAAALVIGNASVAPVGNALFVNIPGQTWRYTG